MIFYEEIPQKFYKKNSQTLQLLIKYWKVARYRVSKNQLLSYASSEHLEFEIYKRGII